MLTIVRKVISRTELGLLIYREYKVHLELQSKFLFDILSFILIFVWAKLKKMNMTNLQTKRKIHMEINKVLFTGVVRQMR